MEEEKKGEEEEKNIIKFRKPLEMQYMFQGTVHKIRKKEPTRLQMGGIV